MLQYFQNFQKSAFRFESLQTYSVEQERDSYQYFLQHGVVNPYYHEDWHTIIENASKRGAIMQRVHNIAFPLSDYLKYELEAYKHNLHYGEEIYYIENGNYNQTIDHDFRLFDDKIVLKMNYNEIGEFLGYQVIENHIEQYLQLKNNLLAKGISINKLL